MSQVSIDNQLEMSDISVPTIIVKTHPGPGCSKVMKLLVNVPGPVVQSIVSLTSF